MFKIPLFFVMIIYQSSFAHTDTTWLNQKWKVCQRDNAAYYSLVDAEEKTWHRQIFYAANQKLYMNGYYTDPHLNIKTGNFKWYTINGLLTDSIVYQNGVPLYMCIFHENGTKKTVLIRDTNHVATYVNSWDQYGNESYLDTFYHDQNGRDCHKDTAFLKGIINKEDTVWRLRFYYVDHDELYTIGYFKERLCKTRVRYGTWYRSGLLRDSILFNDNGKKTEAWYFFDNAGKNAFQAFDSIGKIISARNWDEQGNEIKADTASGYAVPLEGYKAWEKKILKQVNNDVSIDWKYRKNLYSSVYIGFLVEENGRLKQAFVKEPSLYPEMDALILKACKETLQWKPFLVHGRRRAFRAIKCFSYVAGVVIKGRQMYY